MATIITATRRIGEITTTTVDKSDTVVVERTTKTDAVAEDKLDKVVVVTIRIGMETPVKSVELKDIPAARYT